MHEIFLVWLKLYFPVCQTCGHTCQYLGKKKVGDPNPSFGCVMIAERLEEFLGSCQCCSSSDCEITAMLSGREYFPASDPSIKLLTVGDGGK